MESAPFQVMAAYFNLPVCRLVGCYMVPRTKGAIAPESKQSDSGRKNERSQHDAAYAEESDSAQH